jgi:putative peptide zinc metalloprotease protein
MATVAPASDLERRKYVRLRVRGDLAILPQKYEGKSYYVVKDPVSLRYYRFKEQEHYLLTLMDGKHTLDQAQKEFEKRFRPERLTLEDLEQFGQQLLKAGLVQNESPGAGKQLFDNRKKRLRMEWTQTLTNILYIKIPVFDPEKLLKRMLPWLGWMFTTWFLFVSLGVMIAALWLVLSHFETFYSRLPSYHEFFSFKTVVYLWAALGVVKVIHEFGHGLSCKAFGGEVHEMGFLFLCFSPAMYCNVSDAWTLPNKWHRIIISAAGIYVELMIAAVATFVWWNTPSQPFVNHMSLSLMVVCSVSTVLFNGNPLMRYDGYYVLADWLEIPNLRDRANRYLQNLAMEHCLGIEVYPEPYMELTRRILFLTFAIVSYIYRWVVTFVILKFMASFLEPYKLKVVSQFLAIAALGSMIGWPLYRLIKNVSKRGRLPDMKPTRVTLSACAVAAVLLAAFLVPLPVTRVRQVGVVQVQEGQGEQVHIKVPGRLEQVTVKEGQYVRKGQTLAKFSSIELEGRKDESVTTIDIQEKLVKLYDSQIGKENDTREKERLRMLRNRADSELKQAQARYRQVDLELGDLVLVAPRSGVVMGLPQVDEIGKRWDRDQNTLFCTVGNKSKLRVIVPIVPSDFDLVRDNLKQHRGEPLDATVRVQGRGNQLWRGFITRENLPESEAKEVPIGLSNKGGGPLAVKPSQDPKQLVPQAQVYLVSVDIDHPDSAIAVGALAQVKIHCEYRSCAWWVWRTINSTFDLGLL